MRREEEMMGHQYRELVHKALPPSNREPRNSQEFDSHTWWKPSPRTLLYNYKMFYGLRQHLKRVLEPFPCWSLAFADCNFPNFPIDELPPENRIVTEAKI